MKLIFHIATKEDWEKNQKDGQYFSDSLKSQGFIHCCRKNQIKHVVNKIFKDQKDLVLVSINPEKVKADIKEDLVPMREFHSCPHIYGPLNLDAVVKIEDLNNFLSAKGKTN